MLLTGPDVEHLCPFKNLLSSFAPAWLLNITIIHLFRIEGSSFIQESTEVILIPLPPTFWKKKPKLYLDILSFYIYIYIKLKIRQKSTFAFSHSCVAVLSSWPQCVLSSHCVCSILWPQRAAWRSTPSTPTERLGAHKTSALEQESTWKSRQESCTFTHPTRSCPAGVFCPTPAPRSYSLAYLWRRR